MPNKLQGVISCYDEYTLFHNILPNGELGAGKNLTVENLKSIYKVLKMKDSEFMKFKNIIPENVLWFDQFDESVIFYTQPQMKELLFKVRNHDIKNGLYKVPFLLWVYKNKRLKVYALKTKPSKIEDTLYHAPFMNINSLGDVCMGNVKYAEGKHTFDELIEDIETKFFNSYFTHTNHDNLLQMNYLKFLEENIDNKNVSFSKLLVKNNLTIKDIL